MNKKYVSIVNNRATTTSRLIAEKFGKRHDNVLRSIENMQCSDKFRHLNFALSSYKTIQNKELPEFQITYDGFTMLVMGFTGKDAMKFKEEYIADFNTMRDIIYSNKAVFNKILLDYPEIWRKTFPDNFFKGVYSLYNLPFSRSKGTASFVGGFINKYVYDHILNGLSIALKKKRELQKSEKDKLHQYIESNAKEILKDHISKLDLVLQLSNNKSEFDSLFSRYTQPNQMRLAV